MARPEFDKLAVAFRPRATWTDLVLSPGQLKALRQVAADARARMPATDPSTRGRAGAASTGMVVVFAGASGTGKTLAAEVLANELGRSLYRIDLSRVASKYIGETEKNLELLFDKAEADDAILLFDEADALFGKRSEVKDSHDRYANIEVSYLLQRMESHGGIVILETTRRNAIDPALLRRSRHVVDFPQPGAAQRRALWEKAIPPAAAIQEPDLRKLARMEMSGGRISAIAVDAALHAADASLPVDMRMLMEAMIRERRKRGITADDTDVR